MSAFATMAEMSRSRRRLPALPAVRVSLQLRLDPSSIDDGRDVRVCDEREEVLKTIRQQQTLVQLHSEVVLASGVGLMHKIETTKAGEPQLGSSHTPPTLSRCFALSLTCGPIVFLISLTCS